MLAKNKSITVSTDSKYTFHILLSQSVIWKERGLLTTKETAISKVTYITSLLEAAHLPKLIKIVHCKVHQTNSVVMEGNHKADQVTHQAALSPFPSSSSAAPSTILINYWPTTPTALHPGHSILPPSIIHPKLPPLLSSVKQSLLLMPQDTKYLQ